MNYQTLIDSFPLPSSVISVEKLSDTQWGEIRIVCANDAYKKAMGPNYYDNMLYHELVPQDVKFEDFCFRAACLHQRLHAYVETRALNSWTDQTLIPLNSDDENIGYCQFFFEFTQTADPSRMASVSRDVAQSIITENLTLMKSENFLEGVHNLLKDITEMTHALSTRIMLIDDDHDEAINFCEYLVDDSIKETYLQEGKTGEISYETVKSWENMLGVSNEIITRNREDFEALRPYNHLWVDEILSYDIHNIILVPLKQHQTIFGYIYITNYDVSHYVKIKEFIELMSVFLSTQISNYLLMRKLEKISSTDILTGLNNRTMMMDKVKELIKSNRPFGVINLDLNGLKRVNDTEGHDMGDRFIFNAANILLKGVDGKYIYRAGGDEFIIIIDDVTREEFYLMVRQLEEKLNQNKNITFSYGVCWSEDCASVHDTFITADKRMYINKEVFYQKYPELKRVN